MSLEGDSPDKLKNIDFATWVEFAGDAEAPSLGEALDDALEDPLDDAPDDALAESPPLEVISEIIVLIFAVPLAYTW
ncbi:MAG: hypothetical protein C5B49_04020 [Bdellovibrio sp.]|nr:MAG: hypothetical protein C5B49_04020 [Bdellovibrio sp.]